jgi:hypothetical protein
MLESEGVVKKKYVQGALVVPAIRSVNVCSSIFAAPSTALSMLARFFLCFVLQRWFEEDLKMLSTP